ncbi:hypothetical protein HY249_02935 [Candidatus Azambacteria bacterium]|nr:hypothetical protein [Candidatus Azambacteria bacterium]
MHRKILFFLIFGFFCGAGTLVVFAADQIKTTTQLAGASSTAISSSTNFPFAFYIGDNLTGITNPVKSLAFSMSGTYTGNGTLAISLDSDPATTQTFTLPNVGATPTPFEFLYKDPSNKINPTSAGSYSYTLNVIPSGVIIYSFGAEMKESHRYKPTTCGGGYAASGFVESSTFDTGVAQGAGYSSILWQGTLLSDTKVRIQLATSNSSSGPWIYYGPDCTTSAYYGNSPDLPEDVGCPALHNNKRYFRYKTTLCSSIASGCTASGTNTPTVNDVMVNWNP